MSRRSARSAHFTRVFHVSGGRGHILAFWECFGYFIVGYGFFVAGPGTGPDVGGTRSTEYLGIWVSRARVIALSPKSVAASASAEWAFATTRRLQTESKIPEGATKAELARLLEGEAQKAAKAGQLSHALKASYLENQLVPWGIWPLCFLD